MARVIFVDLIKSFNDRHGVYSLSAVMKKNNVDVFFVCDWSWKKILSRISEVKPDLLLYSSFSMNILDYIDFDKQAKKKFNVKSIIGGPGPTFDYSRILDSTIDAICIGEGELSLVDFINNGFKSVGNIFLRSDSPPEKFSPFVHLDSCPFPDREPVYKQDVTLRNMTTKQFFSGRGCPYRCTYCFNHQFRNIFKHNGPIIRRKSVDYLLEEIGIILRKYPLKNILFNDDTFIIDKKWFAEFCEKFPQKFSLTYTCNIRANLVDEEIVKGLHDSRCICANWSIESGNEFNRNTVLKRGMSTGHILSTAALLDKYNIPSRIGNLIGLPGETFNQMLETLRLNIKAKPSLGLANIFVPFPGLELTNYAIKNGYYNPAPESTLPKSYFAKSSMNISRDENLLIQKLMCLFPLFIKFPVLFDYEYVRKSLFKVPVCFSKVLYEIFYSFKMMRLYVSDAPISQKCRVAIRYIVNFLRGMW
jgi:radical SAM superfamily enzyme YgiQ (UPF0313 family)